MSILRYEKPEWELPDWELPAVIDALLALIALVGGAAVLALQGLGLMFVAETLPARGLGVALFLVVVLGGPLAIGAWVVRPMWLRCRHGFSLGALCMLLLGSTALLLWLGAIGWVGALLVNGATF
ncbi:hypothetical protein LJ737_08090 [Hymenobacter sp. 15J16-1T3B]|uniref:hypothetical protein n=1 Tax=Hymenobacter sp. 15J16-1T3B TaxID=2886941 RepID=UPI001D12D0A4|nr:hypothetical protein [Hymenobacter sp. 15J16-1T3B]MCC3157194.1 hypothetical protein [Hymenobacter sp. 15J16-1T3B]